MISMEGNMDFCKYERDFLWFAYLGITPDEAKEKRKSIKACVNRAYLDMCRTLDTKDNNSEETFKNKYSETLVKVFKSYKKELMTKEELKTIREKAYNIFFDRKSFALKDDLKSYLNVKEFNDKNKRQGEVFYYGQAQKWINMTLKYMWLIGLIENEAVEELEVPLDRYIMEAASDDKYGITFPIDNKNNKSWRKYYFGTMPWSKLYKDEYDEIQKNIKDKVKECHLSVIEWECEVWIEQSKKERDKK